MAKENKTTENIAYRILVEPWITEAGTMMAERNQYVFKVAGKATKPEIKASVESVYGVNVLSVRTIHMPAKKRTRGAIEGHRPGFKKAIVSVKEGESINIFEGK